MISCSTETTLFTWKSPEAKFDSLKNILVMGLIKDIEYRDAYEKGITTSLESNGIKCTPALSVLSPAKKYTDEELQQIITNKGFNGIMFLKYQGTKVDKTTSSGKTYTKYYKRFVNSTSSKRYIEEHKTVFMEISLFDASSGEVIWMGSAKTIDVDSPQELAESLSQELIKGLRKDGVIQTQLKIKK